MWMKKEAQSPKLGNLEAWPNTRRRGDSSGGGRRGLIHLATPGRRGGETGGSTGTGLCLSECWLSTKFENGGSTICPVNAWWQHRRSTKSKNVNDGLISTIWTQKITKPKLD
jgi:hypothetical protein